MPKYLPAALSVAAMLIASTAFAERGALESASVKAASDCVAAAALNNPEITTLYRQNRLKEVTDWIVLRSSACDNPLRAMRLLHDRLHGPGTGRTFLLGDYLNDLPRAVRARISAELEKRMAKESGNPVATVGAQKQFVNHNDSTMLMQIGDVSEDASQVKIYYYNPSDKMRPLVTRGTLFFDGNVTWETGLVAGTARIYKRDCEPLEYDVTGVFKGRQVGTGILELQGPAPSFGSGCFSDGYAFDHNSSLKFEPLLARER